jgi:hypothetical protein
MILKMALTKGFNNYTIVVLLGLYVLHICHLKISKGKGLISILNNHLFFILMRVGNAGRKP